MRHHGVVMVVVVAGFGVVQAAGMCGERVLAVRLRRVLAQIVRTARCRHTAAIITRQTSSRT